MRTKLFKDFNAREKAESDDAFLERLQEYKNAPKKKYYKSIYSLANLQKEVDLKAEVFGLKDHIEDQDVVFSATIRMLDDIPKDTSKKFYGMAQRVENDEDFQRLLALGSEFGEEKAIKYKGNVYHGKTPLISGELQMHIDDFKSLIRSGKTPESKILVARSLILFILLRLSPVNIVFLSSSLRYRFPSKSRLFL